MQGRGSSLIYAIGGIRHSCKYEVNFILHLIALLTVTGMGLLFGITAVQWCIVLLCAGCVLSLELINTAAERLCDLVHPGQHPVIRIIKDVMAGAVLITACISVIIGCIIFLPYILSILKF
jgi:diacylglycerol kinase